MLSSEVIQYFICLEKSVRWINQNWRHHPGDPRDWYPRGNWEN